MAKKKIADQTIEDKLNGLLELQQIDSSIDKIRINRGELPLEVQDLEDEVEGLDTRLSKLVDELKELETSISDRKNMIKDAKASIKKYLEQQKNVRNNREFDSISKEIEFQGLEIELAEKKINESKAKISHKEEIIETSRTKLEERSADLDLKKKELADISAETEKEEEKLTKKSDRARKSIEQRLIVAYDRLRNNSKNGLAVVSVERDSCGGCFNKIPPQRQLDIQARKKLIVCEHCGRILVEPLEA
ncbi:MAG: C4-type zinc ribbon domain-containing protein [Crocinitomix sp.]|nr:C4-type zinc ribbon domain-containing protein [Crocinitomix sp.]